MATPPLHERTASELVALLQAGEVSCREVVLAHLARIDAMNPEVHAITLVLADQALAAANAADAQRRTGAELPPLFGVPFTVKETFDCVGSPTTQGVPALRDALPYVDAPIVTRMKAAGAIPLGRTNMSELGLRVATDNPLRGRTHNPFSRRLTVGGSSGGDAAAVATQMAPIGLGADMGGSLRIPAFACGVAALKPTTGRIPLASSLPPHDFGIAAQTMLAAGPIARSIADLRLALQLLAGRDRRDPRSVDVPLAGPPPEERRVALVTELPECELSAAAVGAVRDAGELLTRAGFIVEEASPPELVRVGEVWHKLIAFDLATTLPHMEPILTPGAFAHAKRLCRAAKLEESSVTRLHEERSRLIRAWSGFFAEFSIAIGPTVSAPLWAPDADLDPESGLALLARATRFVLPGNALGLPALAMPFGVADGLPLGIQIYADLWREDLCLEAAELLERGYAADLKRRTNLG